MAMEQIAFTGAAVLSIVWFLVHLLMGGKEVAHPLLVSDLPPMVLQVLYLCWHLVSVTIAIMAILFALAVAFTDTAFAVAGLLLGSGFVLVGVGIIPLRGWNYRTVPQGWLFVPIVGLAMLGLLS